VRAQISVFVIIGLIIFILAGSSIYFFVNKSPLTGLSIESASSSEIREYVETCLKYTLHKSLFALAKTGGVTSEGHEFFEKGNYSIPYYYKPGQSMVPGYSEYKAALEKRIDADIEDCLSGLPVAKNLGFTVKTGKPASSVSINNKSVDVVLDYDIILTHGDELIKLTTFKSSVDVRYGHVLKIASDLTKKVSDHPTQKDYTFFLNQDATVAAISVSPTEDVYAIEDPKSERFENEKFLLLFAVKRKEK
jgi:hypothetical protein